MSDTDSGINILESIAIFTENIVLLNRCTFIIYPITEVCLRSDGQTIRFLNSICSTLNICLKETTE